MADSCQETPKNKRWVRGRARAGKRLKMSAGGTGKGSVLWQRCGARGKPVLETTWEDHRQNGGGRMETERRQLRKLGDRLAGRDSWDVGAFSPVFSAHARTQNLHVA